MNTNEITSNLLALGLIILPVALTLYSVSAVMDVLQRRKDRQQDLLDKAKDDDNTP